MKRLSLIITALILCFSMSACQQNDSSSETQVNNANEVLNEKTIASTTESESDLVTQPILPGNTVEIQPQVNNKDKTVPLNTLTPINGEFTWNEGTHQDVFGNDYSDISNYVTLHGYGCYGAADHFAEYNVEKKYDYIQFTVSPFSEFRETGKAYVQVYVNDVLRYTTEQITQKTQPLTSPQIDISDADYIKIFVHVDGYSCVMLTDVVLTTSTSHTDRTDDNITSLSELSFFNGKLEWHNGFPTDNIGTNYSDAQNYAIVHSYGCYGSATHSVEFYINKNYNAFSFDIAPATEFKENGGAVVKVYKDDELIYTSPTVTQKTTKFSTNSLNIANATYLKIVIEQRGHDCIIISDALLTNA